MSSSFFSLHPFNAMAMLYLVPRGTSCWSYRSPFCSLPSLFAVLLGFARSISRTMYTATATPKVWTNTSIVASNARTALSSPANYTRHGVALYNSSSFTLLAGTTVIVVWQLLSLPFQFIVFLLCPCDSFVSFP